ncbi:MAG: FtsX-like permease family protein, partial [Candidatus Lokiarchaeota archaeon]|nr:FtsX-like permease family protein [Candidatus Lokiarchaeota archaeon]MBD3200837.1 FtsX-like permease family protein [Candidatus Lokiarchaeota archaeon]
MSNFKLVFKYAFKDLTKQKVRTILGVIGVMISVGLLALVLFLADSISLGFIDFIGQDSGNQDLVINVRHYNGELDNRSSYFDYKPIINTIQGTTDEIEHYIPRIELNGKVNSSVSLTSTNISNTQENTLISAINFSLENEIKFGTFIKPKTNAEMELNELNQYNCAIYYGFNEIIKYSEGDTIEIRMGFNHGNVSYQKTINFTVSKIFDYSLKWPSDYRSDNLICIDIDTFYEIFGRAEFEGKCYKLITTFKRSNNLYDIRDVDGSEARVKDLAGDIQLSIGLEEYELDLPKLEILGFSQILGMIFTIAIVFVTIIAMLISGILINGILKTSVEERIREFGIFRTLGAHKSYNLAIVLVQGFLLCNFGTISGLLFAYFGTQFLIVPFANSILLSNMSILGGATLPFSVTLISIISAYLIGVSVGIFVSISPALKVRRLQIIESIHPYRHEDRLYHLQKRSSINYKLIVTGIILALNGGFVFLVIPRILVSFDLSLMAGVLIAILMIFLIGMTLAGLGIMPVILRLLIIIFRPISRRLYNVVKIFVYRYQRRNTSTVIIFALSFSFVLFTSILLNSLAHLVSTGVYLNNGSDLVIESNGWEDDDSFGG